MAIITIIIIGHPGRLADPSKIALPAKSIQGKANLSGPARPGKRR